MIPGDVPAGASITTAPRGRDPVPISRPSATISSRVRERSLRACGPHGRVGKSTPAARRPGRTHASVSPITAGAIGSAVRGGTADISGSSLGNSYADAREFVPRACQPFRARRRSNSGYRAHGNGELNAIPSGEGRWRRACRRHDRWMSVGSARRSASRPFSSAIMSLRARGLETTIRAGGHRPTLRYFEFVEQSTARHGGSRPCRRDVHGAPTMRAARAGHREPRRAPHRDEATCDAL